VVDGARDISHQIGIPKADRVANAADSGPRRRHRHGGLDCRTLEARSSMRDLAVFSAPCDSQGLVGVMDLVMKMIG
jgi:hypothetical protein